MRGILGVVLSACLLVGCGGVEADAAPVAPDALAQQEAGITWCGHYWGATCRPDAEGACFRCMNTYEEPGMCCCEAGYWVCG